MNPTQANQRILRRVCVYCASSRQVDQSYFDAAAALGSDLAQHDITLVYGGGSIGPMGALADAALLAGGRVVGVLPRFMYDLEWGHKGLTEQHLVDDPHERKRLMIEEVDGIVALPGGSGTLEELLEALTWKRLGFYLNPIVLVNQGGYFDALIEQFERAVVERFMDPRHLDMWTVVPEAGGVIQALQTASAWDQDARSFATV